MPYIIVATDFSEVADNALKYACELALYIEADILVLHTYTIPIVFNDLPVPSPLIDAESIAAESMKKLLNNYQENYPQISFKSNITYGNLVDAIEDYAEENSGPEMVIAGNGYNNENHAWLDSTLLQVLRYTKFPVLAVPAGTSYTQVRKICFSYDNKYAGSDVALIKLREISLMLQAELHVLNINNDAMTKENSNAISEITQEVLQPANPVYHVFYEHDIDAAVQDFAAGHQIDWLVVMPRKHSFFENLFHKSHTKVIVNDSHIPLLALHEN